MAKLYKPCTLADPNLPNPEGHGWAVSENGKSFTLVQCRIPPGPGAVTEFVNVDASHAWAIVNV